jgi:hypothetical protein
MSGVSIETAWARNRLAAGRRIVVCRDGYLFAVTGNVPRAVMVAKAVSHGGVAQIAKRKGGGQ